MQKNSKISCVINTAAIDSDAHPDVYEPTDIVVKVYKDRIFIVATHYQKLGTLVSVTRGECLKEFDSTTYDATTLFGRERFKQEVVLAAAKYIAQSIDIDRPLLISLALKSYEKTKINQIIGAIKKLKTW